jgi:hypothetical protein
MQVVVREPLCVVPRDKLARIHPCRNHLHCLRHQHLQQTQHLVNF